MDDIRDAGVVEDRRDDISLCQSVKAVWERERRLDARSARPFLGYQSHVNQIQEYITIEKMKHLTNPLPFPPPFTGLTPTPLLTCTSPNETYIWFIPLQKDRKQRGGTSLRVRVCSKGDVRRRDSSQIRLG